MEEALLREVKEDHLVDDTAANAAIRWAREAPPELLSPFKGEASYHYLNSGDSAATSDAATTAPATSWNRKRWREHVIACTWGTLSWPTMMLPHDDG